MRYECSCNVTCIIVRAFTFQGTHLFFSHVEWCSIVWLKCYLYLQQWRDYHLEQWFGLSSIHNVLWFQKNLVLYVPQFQVAENGTYYIIIQTHIYVQQVPWSLLRNTDRSACYSYRASKQALYMLIYMYIRVNTYQWHGRMERGTFCTSLLAVSTNVNITCNKLLWQLCCIVITCTYKE